MDAAEEEASSKHFAPLEQGSVTALDAPEQLLSTPPQCDIELENLPNERGGDEPAMQPPGPAFGEEERDVNAGELSEAVATGTSMYKRDEAEFVQEKEEVLDEVAKATEVVAEERVLADDAGLPLKNEGIEITSLANDGRETKLIDEAEDKVTTDMANVAGEEVDDGVAWKAEDAEEGNAIGICCPVMKETDSAGQMVDTVDEVDMKDEAMEANDTEAERELAEETIMADTAVETVKVEEGADGAAMPDKTEEALVGTEMAHRAYVAGTMGETTEVDGADREHGIGEADDEVEVTEEINEIGTMDATADAEEEADGPGGEEEALEAEETEIANDADLMEEEADFADTADDTEAAEETEEMEAAEELSRSISGGKRKRGKNSKSTGRVPGRKKMEEDVCFICFDGGELVLCDRR